MLHQVFEFYKEELNAYFRSQLGLTEDTIAYLDGENDDPLVFELGKITPLMVNIEEERTLRPADRYMHVHPEGHLNHGAPVVRLQLFILFIARFKDYTEGLKRLSLLIQYFQARPLFTQQQFPALVSTSIDKLTAELVTLPFQAQNELWGSLKTAYHASALYKINIVSIADSSASISTEVSGLDSILMQ